MRRFFSLIKGLAVSAFILCAMSPLPLLAEKAAEQQEAQSSPWVFPYISFVLCIFLGIAVIGMPAKRDDKPRFDD